MSSFMGNWKNDPRSSQKVGRGILVSWGSYVTPPWEICGCGCDLEGAPPHTQAKSGSPALLGLSIQYFWFFVSINKCYLQNIQICIFIFLAHFILWRIWRHFPTIVFGSLILLNLKFYRVCITTHKPNCTKFSGDFQKTWKRKT